MDKKNNETYSEKMINAGGGSPPPGQPLKKPEPVNSSEEIGEEVVEKLEHLIEISSKIKDRLDFSYEFLKDSYEKLEEISNNVEENTEQLNKNSSREYVGKDSAIGITSRDNRRGSGYGGNRQQMQNGGNFYDGGDDYQQRNVSTYQPKPIKSKSKTNKYKVLPQTRQRKDFINVATKKDFMKTLEKAFLDKMDAIANDLKIPQQDLLSLMYYQTAGTFDPKYTQKQNKNRFGLIGFDSKTTNETLGISPSKLSSMSRIEQLDYVASYLKPFSKKGVIKDVSDLYAAVMYPGMVGANPNDIANIGTAESPNYLTAGKGEYNQYKSNDKDNNGSISKEELVGEDFFEVYNQLGGNYITNKKTKDFGIAPDPSISEPPISNYSSNDNFSQNITQSQNQNTAPQPQQSWADSVISVLDMFGKNEDPNYKPTPPPQQQQSQQPSRQNAQQPQMQSQTQSSLGNLITSQSSRNNNNFNQPPSQSFGRQSNTNNMSTYDRIQSGNLEMPEYNNDDANFNSDNYKNEPTFSTNLGELWENAELTKNPALQERKLLENREIYENVSQQTGVPWYVVGAIHGMESSFDLSKHLHNGDPLTGKTTHVPSGRPLEGEPPFTFEESAIDALNMRKNTFPSNWSDMNQTLMFLEAYNGMGYRNRGINSPYLWSGTNQYSTGKFTEDGKFDPNAESRQIGVVAMLKKLESSGNLDFGGNGYTQYANNTSGQSSDVTWPPTDGVLTSTFGPREAGMHGGVDIGGNAGSDIYATASGNVVNAGYNKSMGNFVQIDHGGGYMTEYMHMKDTPLVSPGQPVSSGDNLGFVGNTGNSRGNHLHFALSKDGQKLNPTALGSLGNLYGQEGSIDRLEPGSRSGVRDGYELIGGDLNIKSGNANENMGIGGPESYLPDVAELALSKPDLSGMQNLISQKFTSGIGDGGVGSLVSQIIKSNELTTKGLLEGIKHIGDTTKNAMESAVHITSTTMQTVTNSTNSSNSSVSGGNNGGGGSFLDDILKNDVVKILMGDF